MNREAFKTDKCQHIDTLIVDSKDRTTGSVGSTDFKVIIQPSVKETNTLNLKSLSIPTDWDNIVTGYNTFMIQAVTYTVPIGLYTEATLISTLNTQTAGVATWALANNTRLVFTSLIGNVLFTLNNMGTTLGYVNATYNGAATYTAENPMNLIYGRYFTLHSDTLARFTKWKTKHTDNRGNIIMTIPILSNVAPQTLLHYEPYDPIYLFNDESFTYDNIDFQLKDEYGDVLDIHNNPISIVFDRLHYDF